MDSGTDHLLVEVRDGGVAVLTFNRPEARNAYSGEMGRALGDLYRTLDADDGIRAIVLTGTPPAFCAGADMSTRGDTFGSPANPSRFSAAGVDPPAWKVRKPVIAAVNGHAIGVGLTLALQCDLRIFAADARYGVVQVRRGVIPDGYSHWTIARMAGVARAADILLTGRTFDGNEARELGIANRVLPNDEVLPAALELAHDIAANTAPLSVAISKRLLWESLTASADEVERLETEFHHVVMGRPDAREGVMAFLERRPPVWEASVTGEWPDWAP